MVELTRGIKAQRTKTRHLSVKEGSFAGVSITTRVNYITPFAIAINASNFIIALLTSFAGFLGPLSQWQSSKLIEKYSRKKIATIAVFFEALMWIPLIIIAFLFYKGVLTSALPLLLLIFFAIYIIITGISFPAWFSWIGDVVDKEYRGRWFAKRNYIIGIITLIFTILSAFFLDFFKKNNWTMFGFMILFSIAGISRLISCYYLKKSYEPKLELKKGDYFSLWQFIKKAPKNNFGRFTIFISLMQLAMYIAGPFFAVYMLRNLGFNYVEYIAIITSQTLFSLIAIRPWGKFADRYGNYEVIKITSILIPFYPLLWLISKNLFVLILGPALIGGIVFAGFNLSATNFIFDSVRPEKRGLAVSYYNVLAGTGIFIGAGIGAILVKSLTISFMDKIPFIFLISAFVRMSVSLIMIPLLKEIRKTEKFDSKKAIKNLEKRLIPSIFEGFHHLAIKRTHKPKKSLYNLASIIN